MVGLGRFELPASSLSGMRSNQLSYKPIAHKLPSSVGTNIQAISGGDDRARTDDLRLAKAALSQLSYIPVSTRVASQNAETVGAI